MRHAAKVDDILDDILNKCASLQARTLMRRAAKISMHRAAGQGHQCVVRPVWTSMRSAADVDVVSNALLFRRGRRCAVRL
jgi:hypothetical protein